jgi:glucose/arabinose dehydrogenase
MRFVFPIYCALLLIFGGNAVHADSVDWPTLGFRQVTTDIFRRPTIITHAGDGSGRLFIAEQSGLVWIVQSSDPEPFLNITDRTLSAGAEQGLLGLVFPPGFSTKQYFYADYTRQTDGAIVISRFFLTPTNSNVADANSEQIIKVIPKSYNFHNAGQLAFGPDGYLYIGVGDGGPEGDLQNIGQKTDVLLGKLLRIDVESGVSPYAVPPDNPFAGDTNYAPEIWALGLRNPWRFSFDRSTGDLYLCDVGQNRYEEIDFQPAGSAGGQNYGWRIMEGPINYNVPAGFTNFSSLTKPVAWYDHSSLQIPEAAGAVVGGYVYHGPSVPRLNGMYFYGDFMAGWIWGMKKVGSNWQTQVLVGRRIFPLSPFMISTFGEDDQGNLYFADYYTGRIYQIQDSGQVWTPTFSPANGTIFSNMVAVTCLTTNAEIHYTTNGMDPTLSDPVVAAGGIIQVETGITNKLRAFRADLSPSGIAVAIFMNKVAAPVFSPSSEAVTNGTRVTISTITPNAVIYYTTNGTMPTISSSTYSVPLVFQNSLAIRAFGAENGYSNSTIAQRNYSLAQAAVPVFNPSSGPITNGTSISIACLTPGSAIYYTLDGSTPTTNSLVYTNAFLVNSGITINAFAAANNYGNSSVSSIVYGFKDIESTVVTTVATGLGGPRAVCMDANGNLYVASGNFYQILKISPSRQTTSIANISSPTGICIDSAGNLYVGDSENDVWKIQTNGTNEVLAHCSGVSGELGQLEVDSAGNVYVGFFCSVEKITPDGSLSIFGGTQCSGCSSGWVEYVGVGMDAVTNIYATTSHHIWQVKQDGTTTLYAGGNDGYSDGPALSSGFQNPQDAVVDVHTNIFVSDVTAVRKISPVGYVSTMAGSGLSGYQNGPGSTALFNGAAGMCMDSNGNIYVADSGNNCIRKISPDTAGIGIADDWQVAHFGYVGIDPNADPDHDGMSNYQEFWAGIDPNDPNSVLAIDRSALISDGHVQIRWQTVAGKTYAVQSSTDLISWTTLGNSVQGDGSVAAVADTSPIQENDRRYYRIAIIGL